MGIFSSTPKGTCYVTGQKGPTVTARTIWGGKREVSAKLAAKSGKNGKGGKGKGKK